MDDDVARNAADKGDAIRRRQLHLRPGDRNVHLCQELADQAFVSTGFLGQMPRMRLVMGAIFAGDFLGEGSVVMMERCDKYHRQNDRQYNGSGYEPSQRQIYAQTNREANITNMAGTCKPLPSCPVPLCPLRCWEQGKTIGGQKGKERPCRACNIV